MTNRTKKLSAFPDLSAIGTTNTQNVKFPLLDLRESDPAIKNKNINFNVLKDEILNRNTVPNVIYVNKRGNDENDGKTFNSAKLSIKAALETARQLQNPDLFDKTLDAANVLLANKLFIVDEVVLRLVANYNSFFTVTTDIDPQDFIPDGIARQNQCRRDIGYIIEAVIKDLRLGGNLNCIQAASTYWDAVNPSSIAPNEAPQLILTNEEKAITLYALGQVKDLIQLALVGWNGAGSPGTAGWYSTVERIVVTYSSGYFTEVSTIINNYFSTMSFIIENGIQSVPPGIGPNAEVDLNDIRAPKGPVNITIFVSPGTYIEENPLIIPSNVAVIGDNLRTCNIIPLRPNRDIFNVNNGSYIYGFTFSGHVDGAAVVAFPEDGAGVIVRSPYVQNCTSLTSTGTGMRVDGNKAQGLKSMVLDAFSQYNQGGTGIEIINGGYAQLVSIFEICCEKAVYVDKGATCSITNSNTDFGKYGLYAKGTSALMYRTEVDGTSLTQKIIRRTEDDVNGLSFKISGIPRGQRPYVGQGMVIGQQQYFIKDVIVVNGGSGYINEPEILVAEPSGQEGIRAQLLARVENGSITQIVTAVSGTQYLVDDFAAPGSFIRAEDDPEGIERWNGTLKSGFITIEAPTGEGGTPATIKVIVEPIFYTVASSTPRTLLEDIPSIEGNHQQGVCEVTILEKIPDPLPANETRVKFYQLSRMIVSSHCFEYVGAGTHISDAIPAKGGVPKQENEVVMIDGGRVVYTSTDHIGNFRIGPDLVVNQDTGTLSGRTFDKSLFNKLTPFILAIQ